MDEPSPTTNPSSEIMNKHLDLIQNGPRDPEKRQFSDFSRFEFRGVLGSGSFGTVNHVVFDGREFAMKQVLCTARSPRRTQNDTRREIVIGHMIESAYVTKLWYHWEMCSICFRDSSRQYSPLHQCTAHSGQRAVYFLLFEYCNGGTLKDFLNERLGVPVPELAASEIMAQIARGLFEMQRKIPGKIVHRDLKPDNILRHHDPTTGKVLYKIADLGLSRETDETGPAGMARTVCGTPGFMAPEVILPKSRRAGTYSHRADFWALGVILHLLVTLEYPKFQGQPAPSLKSSKLTKHEKIMFKWKHLAGQGPLIVPAHITADCATLLTGLLERDPEARFDYLDLMECNFLKQALKGSNISQHGGSILCDEVEMPLLSGLSELPGDSLSHSRDFDSLESSEDSFSGSFERNGTDSDAQVADSDAEATPTEDAADKAVIGVKGGCETDPGQWFDLSKAMDPESYDELARVYTIRAVADITEDVNSGLAVLAISHLMTDLKTKLALCVRGLQLLFTAAEMLGSGRHQTHPLSPRSAKAVACIDCELHHTITTWMERASSIRAALQMSACNESDSITPPGEAIRGFVTQLRNSKAVWTRGLANTLARVCAAEEGD